MAAEKKDQWQSVRGRSFRDESGGAAISLLMMAPLIFMLTFGFLQYGFWMSASLIARSAASHAVNLTAQGIPPSDAQASADQLIASTRVIRSRTWERGPEVSNGVAVAELRVASIKIFPGEWTAFATDAQQVYAPPDSRVIST